MYKTSISKENILFLVDNSIDITRIKSISY